MKWQLYTIRRLSIRYAKWYIISNEIIENKKEPHDISILRFSCLKEGGLLLSRIALQYHRRKWA